MERSIERDCLEINALGGTLADTYAKCALVEAHRVFDELSAMNVAFLDYIN